MDRKHKSSISAGLKSLVGSHVSPYAGSSGLRAYTTESISDNGDEIRGGRLGKPKEEENIIPNYEIESIYGKNFFFQQRRGNLDIRSLSQIDLERVIRDVDIDTIQLHLENITFCNLREEDMRLLTDTLVVKLFRVAQLMIEYLLYVQEQLATNLNKLACKYTDKKRDLTAKRKELAELKEETKTLKSQIRTRKQNVATLESMLLAAKSEKRSRKVKEAPVVSQEPNQPLKPAIVKFYVTGTTGLCIECNERATAFVADVIRSVRSSFAVSFIQSLQQQASQSSGTNGSSSNSSNSKRKRALAALTEDDINLQLVYQGKTLRTDTTIDDNNIRVGDTVVCVCSLSNPNLPSIEDDSPPQPTVAATPQSSIPDLGELLGKQQETLKDVAVEMRKGWEAAMSSMQSNRPPRDHANNNVYINHNEDEDRWNRLEKNMKQQLDAQLDYFERQLHDMKVKPGHVIAGDLESDDDRKPKDDGRVRMLEAELRESYLLIGGLRADIDNLRAQMNNNGGSLNRVEIVHVPIPQQQQQQQQPAPFTKVVVTNNNSAKANKWAKFAGDAPARKDDKGSAAGSVITVQAAAEVQQQQKVVEVVETFEPPVEVAIVQEKPKAQPKAQPTPQRAAPSPAPTPQKKDIAIYEGLVRIRFPNSKNPDLANWFLSFEKDVSDLPNVSPKAESKGNNTAKKQQQLSSSLTSSNQSMGQILLHEDVVDVWVGEDLSLDDLIFDIRRLVAEKAKIPLARVEMTLQSKVIRLGLDINEHWTSLLNVHSLTTYTQKGDICISITTGNPLSDAQIDVLVSEWEKKQLQTSDSGSLRASGSLGEKWPTMQQQQQQSGSKKQATAVRASLQTKQSAQQGSSSIQVTSVSGFERMGSMYLRGDRVLRSSANSNRAARVWDEDEELSNKYEEVYGELDEVLSGLSGSEGLTDDEFKQKMSKLRKSTDNLPTQINDHIKTYREKIVGVVSTAMDSDENPTDYSDAELAPNTMVSVNASLRSSSGGNLRSSGGAAVRSSSGMLRLSVPTHRRRDFDSLEDQDSPLLGSVDALPVGKQRNVAPSAVNNSSNNNGRDSRSASPAFAMSMPSEFGATVVGKGGNDLIESRLRAIESPTQHSRRPSKESVASVEQAVVAPAVGAAGAVSGVGMTGRTSPAVSSNTISRNNSNDRLAATSNTIATTSTAESDLALSKSSSVSHTASRVSRYSNNDEDEASDGERPVADDDSNIDLRSTAEEKLEFRRILQQQQQRKTPQFEDDDVDVKVASRRNFKTATADAKPSFNPNTSTARSMDDASFNDTGFVSMITDEFSSTGQPGDIAGTSTMASTAFSGFDLDSTMESADAKDSATNQHSSKQSPPHQGSKASVVDSNRANDRSLSMAVSEDDNEVDDELSESTNHYTPTKPPAVVRQQPYSNLPHQPSSHSKGMNSPYDQNDDGSLALSDSGVMDNDVEDFVQSFESK